ncbi:MAG: aminotransferase class I/II-fold pyridoxal phosphate-dependent enzyme, partial [Candidatus Omnitrophica bacterium]|nr:aminotransferase class I/II-fold pyridoxal phosphate-dependent enzyme [Candidatus Omnitrophota bacterium]
KGTDYSLSPFSAGRRTWIVTDSLFSMDGDLAPLKELVELKSRYGACLVIDEAHGTGVFGEQGRGVSEYLGVSDEIDVHIGTLSKSVGAFGGFVVGKRELIEYLINHARTFIFETALPAAICAAAVQGLELIEHKPELRKQLWENVKRLRAGLQEAGTYLLESESPIIPVMFGEEKKALDAAKFLFERDFLVPAVRYPTVPKGKARLRVTVSSIHSEAEINSLIQAMARYGR